MRPSKLVTPPPPPEARSLAPTGKYPLEAALLVGTEGAVLQTHGSGPLLLPRDKFKNYPRPNLPPRTTWKLALLALFN